MGIINIISLRLFIMNDPRDEFGDASPPRHLENKPREYLSSNTTVYTDSSLPPSLLDKIKHAVVGHGWTLWHTMLSAWLLSSLLVILFCSAKPDPNDNIWKIVLTGGPSGGKTTALGPLQAVLEAQGYAVVRVPEAATVIKERDASDGLKWEEYLLKKGTNAGHWKFQQAILDLQLEQANDANKIAQARIKKPSVKGVVIIFDRGILDNLAYMTDDKSKGRHARENDMRLLEKALNLAGCGTTFPNGCLKEKISELYDAVIHLDTAAEGAEEHYNNPKFTANVLREKKPENARQLDEHLWDAWVAHKIHYRVENDNADGKYFARKMRKVCEIACSIVGCPFDESKMPKTWD